MLQSKTFEFAGQPLAKATVEYSTQATDDGLCYVPRRAVIELPDGSLLFLDGPAILRAVEEFNAAATENAE